VLLREWWILSDGTEINDPFLLIRASVDLRTAHGGRPETSVGNDGWMGQEGAMCRCCIETVLNLLFPAPPVSKQQEQVHCKAEYGHGSEEVEDGGCGRIEGSSVRENGTSSADSFLDATLCLSPAVWHRVGRVLWSSVPASRPGCDSSGIEALQCKHLALRSFVVAARLLGPETSLVSTFACIQQDASVAEALLGMKGDEHARGQGASERKTGDGMGRGRVRMDVALGRALLAAQLRASSHISPNARHHAGVGSHAAVRLHCPVSLESSLPHVCACNKLVPTP
jgi:hypothetical protein